MILDFVNEKVRYLNRISCVGSHSQEILLTVYICLFTCLFPCDSNSVFINRYLVFNLLTFCCSMLLFAVLESEQAIGDVLCPYQTTELTAFTSIILQACLAFVCQKNYKRVAGCCLDTFISFFVNSVYSIGSEL